MLAHVLGIPVEENVLALAGAAGAGSVAVIVFRARIARLTDKLRNRLWK
jgi:hypothetical protein